MDDANWELDQRILGAAQSAFGALIRYAMLNGRVPPQAVPYLARVETLAQDFYGDGEPYMTAAAATAWQDRALELANPVQVTDRFGAMIIDAAVQVAAIVYQIAKQHGGERHHRQFGFATVFVRSTVSDRGVRADFDYETCTLSPRDMLEFVFLRAADMGVPHNELAGKKARRGL